MTFTGCKKSKKSLSDFDSPSELILTDKNNSSYKNEGSNSDSQSVSESITTSNNVTENKTKNTSSIITKSENEPKTINNNPQPVAPQSYFEKNNLKLSANTTNFCFNNEANHNCGIAKKITFTSENITEHPLYNDESVPKEQISVSNYKFVTFETYGDRNACLYSMISYVFDKYTGTVLAPWEWVEISYNGQTQKIISVLDGGGGGCAAQSVFCPQNYDGLVFVVIPQNHKEIPNDGKKHTIDELIDFKNDKYYMFAESI